MKSSLIHGRNLIAVVLVTLMSVQSSFAKPFCSLMTEFNRAPASDLTGPVTKEAFNHIIDRISAYYAPVVKQRGGRLVVKRLWDDKTINASAGRPFFGLTGEWVVNMYGGLARHRLMTEDAFAVVMCHELGHHLGGYPKVQVLFASQKKALSNEGQSDYFATMKCFRNVYGSDNNVEMMSKVDVPVAVKDQCSLQMKSQNEIALCERSAMAGMVMSHTLWTLSRDAAASRASRPGQAKSPAVAVEMPDFTTPDASQATKIINSHPPAQCRLDTYLSGSICGMASTDDFSHTAAAPGACAEEKGDRMGYRPHCWYKPGR